MTTHGTTAALEAAIDALLAVKFHHVHDWADAQDVEAARAAVRAAITARVEAEVARRLAAADSVDEAIEAFDDASAAYGAAKRGFDLAARERAAAAQIAAIDRLRAAIAADKARAVEAAEDAAFIRGRDAVRKYPEGWGLTARPTPDEARRVVEAHRNAAADVARCGALHASGPGTEELQAECDAEAALLRALGVET